MTGSRLELGIIVRGICLLFCYEFIELIFTQLFALMILLLFLLSAALDIVLFFLFEMALFDGLRFISRLLLSNLILYDHRHTN